MGFEPVFPIHFAPVIPTHHVQTVGFGVIGVALRENAALVAGHHWNQRVGDFVCETILQSQHVRGLLIELAGPDCRAIRNCANGRNEGDGPA